MGYRESRHSNIYESLAARQAELEKKKKGMRGLNIQRDGETGRDHRQ